ncbi:S49 family peptidase [Delftia sp. WSY_7]|uniref:S49 family peptidase n=1 Tax=Delftia sp. WSY_7 TaxID=3367202 RepID=UPI00370C6F39
MSRPSIYPHVAQRIFNTPLLIHPQKLDAIIAGLGQRIFGAAEPLVQLQSTAAGQALAPEMFSTRRGERTDRGWRLVDGVAVLSTMGTLVHRTRLEADSSLLIGYNDLAADLEDAMAHPDVHAVVQVYDSPGGEVNGAFEHAQRSLEMRGRKPMVAVADSMAASAAYLAASAADELVITSTGYAGSIGVVMRHVDLSRALANEGITVTHIFAGAHKVDGNPYEALPAAVRESLQADIDGLYSMFVQAVATHRGMSDAAVRKTQAATYRGVAAVAAGLADRIGTVDAVIAELATRRARSYPAGPGQSAQAPTQEETTMTTSAAPQSAAPNAAAPAAQAAPAPAAAGAPAPAQIDAAQAAADGAAAERQRVVAILAHPASATHPAIAQSCIAGALSAEQAKGVLDAAAAAPAASGTAGASDFAKQMAALGNPSVSGVEPGTGQEAGAPGAISQSWATAFGTRKSN